LNSKELNQKYNKNKDIFHRYINNIKENMEVDIYSIINATLVKNPYNSSFPKKFFINKHLIENNFLLFIKYCIKFYLKQFYFLFSYLISFFIFKIFYKKKEFKDNGSIGIDIFFLVDNIVENNKFEENYFIGLYDVLNKYNQDYIFIPRLYGIGKNPFKLIKLFQILNKDKRNFLFEFELFSIKNFLSLFIMILLYPFKTLRLLQKEDTDTDKLFNNELLRDINSLGFDAFSRYLFGQNIAKFKIVNKIYSWSEFQVIERSFNFAIRKNNNNINLIACQFYLNYEIYFNTYICDLDYNMLSSPHSVLVNGKYYILNINKVKYINGVSLRYKKIFDYNYFKLIGSRVVVLGSYMESDTKYMIDSVSTFKNVLFKNHPVVDIERYGKLNKNIRVVNENIYELFKDASIVISTGSGTLVEAVACGISVIVIASQDNLTANPLVKYGKGKIWDIAFSKDDVKRLYDELIEYRKNNLLEIHQISEWYKNNFFIKPTEENIVKAFELDMNKDRIK